MTTPAAHAADAIDRLMVPAEACAGYRERLERLGFSAHVAEQVAAMVLVRMTLDELDGQRTGRRGRRRVSA